MSTQEDVRRIALSFPQTTESDSEFSFRVAGKQFVGLWRERVDPKRPKVPNPGVIVLPVADLGEKKALLATDPETFFTTDHYDGCSAVLVRLPKVDTQELAELITDAWRVKAPTKLLEELEGW
jgi:hypothetical protein